NYEDELPVFLENTAEYNLLVEQNNNYMIGRESIIDLAQHSEVIENNEIYTEDSQNSNIELENVTHISAPSIIEPIFPKVLKLLKDYLPSHILSIQHQQILGSLLYHARLISKKTISIIQEDPDQLSYNTGFLEDQLDRPQIAIHPFLNGIQLSDVLEIWKLFGLITKYKHFIVLLNDGEHLCTCLAIINCGLVCLHYFHIMMNSKAAKFNRTIEAVTQFQQVNSNCAVVSDLHILDQFRVPHMFTTKIKQHVQKKVKFASGFEKLKAALNLAIDMGCKDEFIDMINGFINRKKSSINNTNNENNKNLHILDPLLLAENNSYNASTKRNAINPIDPNLYVRNTHSRYGTNITVQPLQHISSNNFNENQADISTKTTQIMKENTESTVKQKYICKIYGNPGHNSRRCDGNSNK
ncbi:23368_t:CDS:2, partial [Cetraspora pellucida]